MGEPGGLPSIGSHRVGHGCSDLARAIARASQVALVESACNAGDTGAADSILRLGRSPGGESHGEEPGGLQSMGHKELDMTEHTHRDTHTLIRQRP